MDPDSGDNAPDVGLGLGVFKTATPVSEGRCKAPLRRNGRRAGRMCPDASRRMATEWLGIPGPRLGIYIAVRPLNDARNLSGRDVVA